MHLGPGKSQCQVAPNPFSLLVTTHAFHHKNPNRQRLTDHVGNIKVYVIPVKVHKPCDGTGISWTICKQPAPHSIQITTPTPHHSIFTGRMLFLTPNRVKALKATLKSYVIPVIVHKPCDGTCRAEYFPKVQLRDKHSLTHPGSRPSG